MRYPPDERRVHVELWRESGLSKAAYCRQAGLPYHCLVAWTRDASAGPGDPQDQAAAEAGTGFIELIRHDDPREWVQGVTVDLGAGRRVLVPVTVDPAWAGRLLGAVFGC
jgi:hypothetical protein